MALFSFRTRHKSCIASAVQPMRTECARLMYLESRMLGNLHVRFRVGAGVQFHGLHHAPMARVCLSLFEQRFLAPLVCLGLR